MRLFFCGLPAITTGLIGFLFHPLIGLTIAIAVFGLGWQVTEVRPERGEQ